jgi:hypothetical protein
VPKIAYIDKKIGTKRLAVIHKANEIIAEYLSQGFRLTLRQLYYQFVSRGLIANNMKEYALLGSIINDGRLVGLIDWNAIEDRTRNVRSMPHWSSPSEIMKSAAHSFGIDKWADQPYRVEVWIEKDALAGIFEGVCSELDVPYFSCRGYTSQSEMWAGAMRLKQHLQNGQNTLILHFGDHDPSGKDMTRDIEERLELFMGGTELRRLALNMDQIEEHQPPPNPAKTTDSRSKAYIAEFGDDSWELDAMEPALLVQLVRDSVASVLDEEKWDAQVERENTHKRLLEKASKRWDDLVDVLNDIE